MLNIVIPMAGLGSRFTKEDYSIPKPFIQIKGKPMIAWALQSLRDIREGNENMVYFIINKDLNTKQYRDMLYSLSPNSRIIALKEMTDGQAQTVLHAKKYINNSSPLLIYNCDTLTVVKDFIPKIRDENKDGAIVVFEHDNPAYSYTKIENESIVEVIEKKVISPFATSGMYYFSRGADYVKICEYAIKENLRTNNEFYVAPLYNLLINRLYKFSPVYAEKVVPFGTPKELETSINEL